MAVFCITSSNPKFQKLLAESGQKPLVFEMMVSKWMTNNEVYDRYPTLQELGISQSMPQIESGVEENLKTFFTQFGFQFKEGDSSTDLLQKIIYTNKEDNNVFIDNSVKALSQLLLANTNIDFNKLQDLIEETSEFKNLLKNSSKYLKNTHKYLKDGNRIPMEEWVSYIKEYNKIKNAVLEKYLKESLLDKKNSTKLHQLINDFLKFFKDLFNNAKNLKEITDSLIQQVLLNQKEVVINSKDLKNKEKVTLAKALKETSHGKDIIKTFGEFGLILTGSISAAEQGSVFRKTGKLLHDIDWVVPKGFTKDFNKKLKDIFPGATLVREFDSSTYYTQTYIVPPKGYTISNLTFFKPEIYGKNKYIASYDVLDKNSNIVSNYRRYYDVKESGKVVENREVYNEGLQNVDKNLEAVSVDFFQNKEELKFKPYTVNVEGIELQLSNWMSSFTEKLKYGRAKDLLDYANFIPNDLISSEIKPGVEELFNEDPELANQVYEALGFNTSIVPNKVVSINNTNFGDETPSDENEISFNLKDIEIEEFDDIITKNKATIYFTISDKKALTFGKRANGNIGEMMLQKKDNIVTIASVALYSPNVRVGEKQLKINEGKGIGKYIYELVGDKLLDNGLILKSDTSMSISAKNVWDYFVKNNKAEKTKDNTYFYRGNQITPQQKQQALQLYSQYLDTIQNQVILPSDKIVFGHPTIGKSYLKKQGENRFITLDDDYANEVNAFVDANRGSETRQEYKGRKPKEYNEFMLNLFDRLKVQAQKEGKILFVSNTNILKERMSDFDKVINIPKDEFKKRFDARGSTYGFEDWKSDIDATIARVPNNKVIITTGYLSDLFLGSKQYIEGFKEFVSGVEDRATESGLSLSSDEAIAYNSLVNDGTIPIKCE